MLGVEWITGGAGIALSAAVEGQGMHIHVEYDPKE